MSSLHSVEGESCHCTADSKNFTILYYNARSLIPKLDELRTIVEFQKPSAICIVETWLSTEITDQEITLPGYQVIRLDRNRHGGEIVIYVQNAITTGVLLSGPNGLELLALSVCSPNSSRKHCIALLYRPPSCPVSSFFDNLYNALQFLNPSRFANFVLLGDFNINFCTSHPYFCKLQSVTQPFSLSQVVGTPTHFNPNGNHTLIDLAFVPNREQVSDCTVTAPLANSDHCGLTLSLNWTTSQRVPPHAPKNSLEVQGCRFPESKEHD